MKWNEVEKMVDGGGEGGKRGEVGVLVLVWVWVSGIWTWVWVLCFGILMS